MSASNQQCPGSRNARGASLVLVLAIFGGAAILIMLFCLNYVGFIGSYHEQRSAIEAAVLAAAKDLSSIVIDDPNFGLVGLSDYSPIGTATVAGDNYYTSVTGINTLLATIRLDMIIADYLQDPIMKQLAVNDYNNALTTQKNLVSTLNAAATTGGVGKDLNGATVNPTLDATNAYNSNLVHLVAGETSTLVPESLTLTLGYVNGFATRTQIPQPRSVSNVAPTQQAQGFYLANTNIPYNNNDFVFAALESNATLVDFKAFQAKLSALPYSIPTVIKIDADEKYAGGSSVVHKVHATACALAGSVVDQRPAPGALTLTFPDGPVPEIRQLGDLINNQQIATDPTDALQTPANGDYPQTALVQYSFPKSMSADPTHPKFEEVWSQALYDWLKRGGTSVNVRSLINILQAPMNFAAAGPQMQRFHITSSGAITNDSVAWGKTNLCVSQNQFRATSGLGLHSSNNYLYDLQITDFVHVPGRKNGGQHAGEPLNYPGHMGTNAATAQPSEQSMYENPTWQYQEYLVNSATPAIRPTYSKDGIAVDFTIRMRH